MPVRIDYEQRLKGPFAGYFKETIRITGESIMRHKGFPPRDYWTAGREKDPFQSK